MWQTQWHSQSWHWQLHYSGVRHAIMHDGELLTVVRLWWCGLWPCGAVAVVILIVAVVLVLRVPIIIYTVIVICTLLSQFYQSAIKTEKKTTMWEPNRFPPPPPYHQTFWVSVQHLSFYIRPLTLSSIIQFELTHQKDTPFPVCKLRSSLKTSAQVGINYLQTPLTFVCRQRDPCTTRFGK